MKVRIYQPSKSAMQSGRAKSSKWVIECDDLSQRKPNDVMGWTQSGDALNQIKVKFDTVDMAVEYAKKEGWKYTISPSQSRKITAKNYSDTIT